MAAIHPPISDILSNGIRLIDHRYTCDFPAVGEPCSQLWIDSSPVCRKAKLLARQKKSWVVSGSGSLPSE